MTFPDSSVVNDDTTAFMVGDSLLVAPIVDEGSEELAVPLPGLVSTDRRNCVLAINRR